VHVLEIADPKWRRLTGKLAVIVRCGVVRCGAVRCGALVRSVCHGAAGASRNAHAVRCEHVSEGEARVAVRPPTTELDVRKWKV